MEVPFVEVKCGGVSRLELVVEWPERIFPSKFNLDFPNWRVWGYLVDYDRVGFKTMASRLFEDDLDSLVTSNNDYLIFLQDKTSGIVKVATGLSAMFPLFFAVEKSKMFLSTDFGRVFRSLKNANLDADGSLDYLLTESSIYLTDKTFVSQIRQLPPGCVLTINGDLTWKIDEPFSWQKYLRGLEASPMKPDDFAEAMIETLRQAVRKRLAAVKNRRLSCDLSSGFDCDLVAYLLKQEGVEFGGFSYYTRLNNHDTDIGLVEKFAQRHGINVNYSDVTDLVYFSSDEELRWNKEHLFPGTHSLSLHLKAEGERRNLFGDYQVAFSGDGGDEFYHSYRIVSGGDEEKQQFFNFAKLNIESGAGNLLSDGMVQLLQDDKNWRKKRIYSNALGSAAGHQIYHLFHWNSTNWVSSPFDDLDLIKLAPRIPLDDSGEPLHKHEIFKNRTDIFLPEQFRVKLPYHEQAVRYLDLSLPMIEKILEDSVFGKLGWINVDRIRQAIGQRKLKEYVGDVYLMFGNILRLEVFLQGNGLDL